MIIAGAGRMASSSSRFTKGGLPVIKQFSWGFVAAGMALGAEVAVAQKAGPAAEAPELTRSGGMVMLDYEVMPIPGNKALDLMGFHFLNKMSDWLYFGVGGYAPLFRGEYGGFMALDVTAHAQKKIAGSLFVDGGVSVGGGGGGRNAQASRVVSGTGGFFKTYLGLGYEFETFSVGANVARMKFSKSSIDHSQLNVFVQVPFTYTVGSYASSGERFSATDKADAPGDFANSSESILNIGVDNYVQIQPTASNKNTINIADLQFSHFITKNSYWFFNASVGYHGMPLYNQVLGGLGYRMALSPGVNLYGQLGMGSGGYALDVIDTGPGLMIYPKVAAEYMIDKNIGVLVSAGYLLAAKGSSRNYTFGTALNYHLYSGERGSGSGMDTGVNRGFRFDLFQQTEFKVKSRDTDRGNIKLLSAQLDNVVSENFYVPVQVSIAYNTYLGFPGYGELLAGVGVQNKYTKGDRWQVFGQVLAGANVHGAILKTGVGLNYGLSDHLAVYATAGQTLAFDRQKFSAAYAGVGISYRFSVPSF